MQTNSNIRANTPQNMRSQEYLQQVHEVHVPLVSSDPNTAEPDPVQDEASMGCMRYLTCLLYYKNMPDNNFT